MGAEYEPNTWQALHSNQKNTTNGGWGRRKIERYRDNEGGDCSLDLFWDTNKDKISFIIHST